MKKFILFVLMILFGSTLFGCNSSRGENSVIFGNYIFDEIVYLSPLSSSSIDYMKENIAGTEYTIKKDSFKIVTSENVYEISKPIYERNMMDDDSIQAFNNAVFKAVPISQYKEKYQYIIYDKENQKLDYYLYSIDDELWIASYVDNTANKIDIIMYIYKLK